MDITIGDFPKLRNRTRELASKIQPRLDDHLTMVKEQFRPALAFGGAVSQGAREAPQDASIACAQFRSIYADVAASLNVSGELSETLSLNSAKPILSPFYYSHRIVTPTGAKEITVKSLLRFVVSFPDYPYDQLLALAGVSDRKPQLRDFALHYTALNFLVTRNRRLLALFEDLKYPVRTEKNEKLGNLPITTIAAPFVTVLPPDDVIALVCEFSGANTIEEVIPALDAAV
jgi:hypothetical protein